jgi:hypothetical protein
VTVKPCLQKKKMRRKRLRRRRIRADRTDENGEASARLWRKKKLHAFIAGATKGGVGRPLDRSGGLRRPRLSGRSSCRAWSTPVRRPPDQRVPGDVLPGKKTKKEQKTRMPPGEERRTKQRRKAAGNDRSWRFKP